MMMCVSGGRVHTGGVHTGRVGLRLQQRLLLIGEACSGCAKIRKQCPFWDSATGTGLVL